MRKSVVICNLCCTTCWHTSLYYLPSIVVIILLRTIIFTVLCLPFFLSPYFLCVSFFPKSLQSKTNKDTHIKAPKSLAFIQLPFSQLVLFLSLCFYIKQVHELLLPPSAVQPSEDLLDRKLFAASPSLLSWGLGAGISLAASVVCDVGRISADFPAARYTHTRTDSSSQRAPPWKLVGGH